MLADPTFAPNEVDSRKSKELVNLTQQLVSILWKWCHLEKKLYFYARIFNGVFKKDNKNNIKIISKWYQNDIQLDWCYFDDKFTSGSRILIK
jgi:hypothetical protein